MKTPRKGKQGFVLILSLLYIFLIAAFLTTLFVIVSGGLRQANRLEDGIRAYYVADAGLADAFMQLRAAADNAPMANFPLENASYPVGPNGLNGIYNVTIATDGAEWATYTFRSTGTFGSATKTLTLRVKKISFSRWFYLSNSELWNGYRLYWVTDMLTLGPVHTNGQLNILGTPIFDGPVSQVNPAVYYYPYSTNNPDFQHGLTLGAPPIYFPTDELLNNVRSGSRAAGGLFLRGNTWVTLVNDGTMKVTNPDINSGVETSMALPTGKALYVEDGDVTVKGTLQGQLTVASNRNVKINGNILYKTDPRITPASTDVLGLVARNNVIVTADAPNNIEIDASIVALTGSFQADNYGYRPTGNMVQYGGLANYTCGPTGTVYSNGTYASGYCQFQYYDERFHDSPPPWYTPARDTASGRIAYLKLDLKES